MADAGEKTEKMGQATLSGTLAAWLSRAPVPWFILYAASAAFFTYFCMYAFRKPIAVGTFVGIEGWGFDLDFKSALMIAQVIGYAASKWIGVKVISEMAANRRAVAILSLIVLAELALVGFAVLPAPYNVVMLLLNGLPLGLIWGLVFSFLEGRQTSEVLGAGLACSFIVSSGVVKTLAKYLMVDFAVTEMWMPAVTGALFLPPLFASVFFLSRIPAPSKSDEDVRAARSPMAAAQRRQFFGRYALGLVLLIVAYVLFTAFRDFRDAFAAEVWISLGFGDAPEVFALADTPTALIVLIVLGATMAMRDNLAAMKLYHVIVATGAAILIVSTLAFQTGLIGGLLWMMLLSLGLYLAYVPFNCILFDRLMAVARHPGNAGFLIYLADASGYVGSVGVMLYKAFAAPGAGWQSFLEGFAYVTGGAGILLLLASLSYFSGALTPAPPGARDTARATVTR